MELLESRKEIMNLGILDCEKIDSQKVISQIPTKVPFLNKISINPPPNLGDSAFMRLYRAGTLTLGPGFDHSRLKADKVVELPSSD